MNKEKMDSWQGKSKQKRTDTHTQDQEKNS